MLLTTMCHTMPYLAFALKRNFFDVDIVVKKQIERGLALSVLLSATIHVITVVKI